MKGKLRTVTAAILCADEAVTPRFPPRVPVLAAKMGDGSHDAHVVLRSVACFHSRLLR